MKRLQNEVLDLEDFDDNITLSDFSLDEFRLDLLQFLESRRAELEAANPGLYAVVPPKVDNPLAQPGVIFCLQHCPTGESETPPERGGVTEVNPLGRYYLIYVLDDGTVRLTFAHPKQALNLLRDLAAGHPSALEELCDLFDLRTKDGSDMSLYDQLIKKALESIKRTFSKRAMEMLVSGRSGRLPEACEIPSDLEEEYKLLTWLVILDTYSE